MSIWRASFCVQIRVQNFLERVQFELQISKKYKRCAIVEVLLPKEKSPNPLWTKALSFGGDEGSRTPS